MKTFEQWIQEMITAYLVERPAPQKENYPYPESFESAKWTHENNLDRSTRIWKAMEPAWNACASEYSHKLRNLETALTLKSDAFELLKKKNEELEKENKNLKELAKIGARLAKTVLDEDDERDFDDSFDRRD